MPVMPRMERPPVGHDAPVPDAQRDALFLDFDGTLAELRPRPEQAALSAGMRRRLERARDRLQGRLAIVSGRSLETLDRLVGLDGLALVGVHGLERRLPDGREARAEPAPGLAAARAMLSTFVAREPGLLLEDKGLSVALHYRQVPGLAPLAHARAHSVAQATGLSLQTGKMVIELRTPGSDKGTALAQLLAHPPFAGFRPLFVGDDDTDESAFAAAARLGGAGIRVGAPAPGSAARHRLPDVAAVGSWLEAIG